ncbi:MAG TPA: hypothetical protein VNH19_06575 [Candidatus Limnocylindrales bacterium]|nr:hypothetical protein [Candidatus Limnocylindrales bacterium]
MLSRWIGRFAGLLTVCLALCAAASAQYGGGGGTGGSGGTGGTGGGPGYVAPSGGYGSGKAIGIGVGAAAGATVAVVLLVRHHRHAENNNTQAYVTGCTQAIPNGISLTSEKDNQTYSIVSSDNSLKAGERVTLKGSVVSSDGSANPSFQVTSMVKNFGTCGEASASNSSSLGFHSLNGLTNFRRTSADQLP